MNTNHEIEKSYRGLLATVFGVAHTMSDDEINRPTPDMYDWTPKEIMELRESVLKSMRPALKLVKDN